MQDLNHRHSHRIPRTHGRRNFRNLLFYLITAALLLIFVGCSRKAARVDTIDATPVTVPLLILIAPPDAAEIATRLAADLGQFFGDGIRLELVTETTESDSDSKSAGYSQSVQLHLETRYGPASDRIDGVVVDRQFYAPGVHFLDSRMSVEISVDEWMDDRIGLRIVPLEEIRLPRKALAVSGAYPDDPEYPLVRETVLTWRIPEGFASAEPLEEWLSALPSAPPPPEIHRIATVGDMMLQRGISRTLIYNDNGLDLVFHDTLPVLRSHDLTVGNLEGAVTIGGEAVVKSYTFRFPPEVLSPLKEAGFDYVSLTNNHAFDYGVSGFLDTLSHLHETDIGTSGAGSDLDSTLLPWEVRLGDVDSGIAVRVFSLGAYPRERNGFDGLRMTAAAPDRPGVLWATEENVAELSRRLDTDAFDIVMVHGGTEWSRSPKPGQIELYRDLAEAGADLVIGSHPHVLQPVEAYRGSLIAYSLGNFLFAGMEEMPYAEETIILSAGVLDDRIVYVDFYPVIIDGPSIDIARDGSILERFIRLSEEFHADVSR